MSGTEEHSIPNKNFMIMGANLLAKAFFEANRTDAKRSFLELCDSKRVGLSRVVMDDKSTIDVFLSMNCDEYCGKISFSHFREQLRLLLKRFATALENDEPLEVLAEQGGVTSVFKMPVLHSSENQVNALILGWAATAPGQLELRLLYLDPEQFRVDNSESDSLT
ncbi:MAG: hypothetical protein AAF542_17360 [Pseudomonadota bacterium]